MPTRQDGVENRDKVYLKFILDSGNVNDFINSATGVELYKILPNPDKFDESDPDLMLSTPSPEYYSITDANNLSSSETQGQIVGARESINGRKNIARRKVKNGEKSPWGQCLTGPVPNGRRRSAF